MNKKAVLSQGNRAIGSNNLLDESETIVRKHNIRCSENEVMQIMLKHWKG